MSLWSLPYVFPRTLWSVGDSWEGKFSSIWGSPETLTGSSSWPEREIKSRYHILTPPLPLFPTFGALCYTSTSCCIFGAVSLTSVFSIITRARTTRTLAVRSEIASWWVREQHRLVVSHGRVQARPLMDKPSWNENLEMTPIEPRLLLWSF